uniref:TYR_PHOSPHATASE_2 domain-containing protein n=1 Tax=Trichobilharzia regenti TaxID=157069 RepID=A0AA85KBF3_TRIRE|nr:unnamed protein product [Trichobilharzia regenti]
MYIFENLNWDGKYDKHLISVDGDTKSLNSSISDKVRQGIPEKNICSLFCGGSKCKYCDPPSHFDVSKMQIYGLYSTWITPNILASSRPSRDLVDRFAIIDQFQKMNICSIFNMQTPGEHSSCGYGVLSSGFSYEPSQFMQRNIFFYNFSWCDYGVASLSFILDTVVVIQFSILKGKVAIHCHAGLGRTGVIIACYLVFNNRISAGEAIRYVRFRRPGSIQTQNQVESIYQFEKFLHLYRINFGSHLSTYLQRQNALFHGSERRKLRNIPKIVYMCCKLLVRYAKTGCTSIQTNSPDFRSVTRTSEVCPTPSTICTNNLFEEENESVNTNTNCTYENNTNHVNIIPKSPVGVNIVVEALLTTQYPESVVNEAEYWKRKFNNDPEVWDDFVKNPINPLVLVKLINDWLTHLKSPVLRVQDLLSLQQNPLFEENILESLETLEKPVVCLMSLFARLITNLQPLCEIKEYQLIQRILNWLCQNQSKAYTCHQLSSSTIKNAQTIISTDSNNFNVQLPYHSRFDDSMRIAIRIMRFLIDFVKPNCGPSVEKTDSLSSYSSSTNLY